jgi:two-component system NtrC family sensor kinase
MREVHYTFVGKFFRIATMNEDIKILCVDDEKNVLRALQRVFIENDNYTIITAESGEEALDIVEQQPDIQVIVSDYRMPGMSGVEFLARSAQINPDTMRIILSGFADTNAMLEAINIGHVFKFVPKPWNDEELCATVAQAVEVATLKRHNRELQRKLEESNAELHAMNTNLEKLVEQRTRSLQLRSHVLQLAQEILEQIPLGVVGLDNDNHIVLINSFALDLLSGDPPIILGDKADTHFDTNLLAFIENVRLQGDSQDRFHLGSTVVQASGDYMNKNPERGIFITLNRIDTGGGN